MARLYSDRDLGKRFLQDRERRPATRSALASIDAALLELAGNSYDHKLAKRRG